MYFPGLYKVLCFGNRGGSVKEISELDYDNLQQKQILDAIALYVMADDSGLLCDAYNTTIVFGIPLDIQGIHSADVVVQP